MGRPKRTPSLIGTLVATGVAFLAYGYLRSIAVDGDGRLSGLPAILGFLAVAGALAVALITRPEAVVRMVGDYWLLFAMAAATSFALFVPSVTLARLPVLSGMPEWMARLGVLVLVEGAAFGVHVVLVRWGGMRASDRVAAMANRALLIQIAVGLLVAVNVVAQMRRDSGSLRILDLTEMQAFTLSDESRGLLEDVETKPGKLDATFFVFGTSGPLAELALDFLGRYEDYCGSLSVKAVNALRDPLEAKERFRELGLVEYDISSTDTVVFTFLPDGERVPRRRDIEVTPTGFFEPGLGTDKFVGEQLFSSAIRDVAYERKKVYFVTGHLELSIRERGPTGLSAAGNLLDRLALDAEELSLSGRGSIPGDAGLLVIAGPQTPLEAAHARVIARYLDDGGALLLMVEPQASLLRQGGELMRFGLEEYLAALGLRARTDHVSMDHEIVRRAGGIQQLPEPTPVLLTEAYSGGHPAVKELMERRIGCRFVEACPIEVERVEARRGETVTAQPLVHVRLTLPEVPGLASYAARLFPGRDPSRPDPNTDIMQRRLHVVAAAERVRRTGVDERGRPTELLTRVAVVGDTDFASNRGLVSSSNYYAPGNGILFSNLVSWAVEREGLMSIDPKVWERQRVALEERESRLAKVVGLYGLPLLVLLLGLGIAWSRRR